MRKKVFLFLICLLLFAAAVPSYGGQATLCWDPPTTNADGTPLTDLGGYNIYYGTSSGNYSVVTDMHLGECSACSGYSCSTCSSVPIPCTYTVTNLSEGVTYWFVATAYDTSANESGYSNEVSKTISLSTYTLTISKSGTGSGTVTSSPAGINCGSTCSYDFNAGTVITLTAAAASGSTFTGWTDGSDYKGSGAYSFSLSANRTVSAGFATNSSLRYLLWHTASKARVWYLDEGDNKLGASGDYSLEAGEAPIGFSMDSNGGTLATYTVTTRTTRLRQLDTNYNLTGYYKDYPGGWIGKGHALNKLLWYYASTNTSKVWTMDGNYNRTGSRDYTLPLGLPVSYCNTGGGTGAIISYDSATNTTQLQHLNAIGDFSSNTSWTTSWILKSCAASRLLWYYSSTGTTRIWTTNASDGRVSVKEYSSGSWMPIGYSIFSQ